MRQIIFRMFNLKCINMKMVYRIFIFFVARRAVDRYLQSYECVYIYLIFAIFFFFFWVLSFFVSVSVSRMCHLHGQIPQLCNIREWWTHRTPNTVLQYTHGLINISYSAYISMMCAIIAWEWRKTEMERKSNRVTSNTGFDLRVIWRSTINWRM